MTVMKPCRRRRASWAIGALGAVLVAACATVPYTNRSQLLLISESEEMSLGADAYKQVLAKERVTKDPALLEPVRRVGQRIAAVAERPDYEWEFTVIDNPKMVNAFALPGGKVAVYTGLFPVAQDEAGLAAVMGHEVAHALARHSGERLSQGVLLQVGLAGASIALGGGDPTTRSLVMQALGLGTQVGVILPFNRSQESEADHIGMILMAKAGYEPEAALHLWERMEQAGGGGPPEFLSTHPSYGTRQEQIRGWLPEARRYFSPANGAPVQALPSIRAG
jgi:predicted Zn-dependent protease